MKTLVLLFYEFFKVGLFSLGGGLATIPFLRSIADRYPWFSVTELSDMIAVSESTPGPIGINMATYSGYNAGFSAGGVPFGILGGVIATLGIVCPAILVICVVSKFLEKFKTNRRVADAFYGIRPAVSGLIAGAMAGVFIAALFFAGENGLPAGLNLPAAVLFAVLTAAYALLQKKLHPVVLIAVGAAFGILLRL